MQIPVKQNSIDIYSLGFDAHLNRQLTEVQSPVVYNQIEERLSRMVSSGDSVSSFVANIPLSNFDTLQVFKKA